MPIRSYVRSTDCNGVSHRQNISTGVDIPVVVCSAVGTVPLSDIQRQFINNMSAVATAFRTGKPSVNFYQVSTIPLGFVFQLPHQLAPCSITDSTGKFGILDHILNCQILNHYRLVFTNQSSCQFVGIVFSGIRDFSSSLTPLSVVATQQLDSGVKLLASIPLTAKLRCGGSLLGVLDDSAFCLLPLFLTFEF